MKISKWVMMSGLAAVMGVASLQTFATEQACPADFKVDKSHCHCTSKVISCGINGVLVYPHKTGISVKGKTLYTKDGVAVTCKGKTWHVSKVSNDLGFTCRQ